MTQKIIGFVGFGEAAQCFAAHLAAKGVPAPLVFCDGPSNHPPYTDAFRRHGRNTSGHAGRHARRVDG